MEFEWDTSKSERNRRERGFDFRFASTIFNGATLDVQDTRRAYGEVRMRATGAIDGAVLVVIYTDRGGIRRIISARLAKRKEREEWLSRG